MAKKDEMISGLEHFFNHGVSVTDRTVEFFGPVDADKVKEVIKGLNLLEQLKTAPIRILLNSDGGDVGIGLGLFDFITQLNSHVTIDIYGSCESMAAHILQAADLRRISKNSYIMIHTGTSALSEQHQTSNDNWYTYLKKQETISEDILLDKIRVKHPSYTRAKLRKLLQFDTILTATEALELGLVDEII